MCVGEGLDRGGWGGREWGKEAVAVKPSAFARTMKVVLARLEARHLWILHSLHPRGDHTDRSVTCRGIVTYFCSMLLLDDFGSHLW